MSFALLIRIALRALRRNKLRSALTILGIVIGVAAVIAMVSLGAGAEQRVQKEIASLGTEMIIVFPGSTSRGGVAGGFGSQPTLDEDDAAAMARECAAIRAVSPSMRSVMQIVSGNANWATTVVGTTENFPEIRQWKIASGRFFTDDEVRSAAKVCVLGESVAGEVFGDRDPLGQQLRVKNTPCTVIGVLEPKGQNPMGQDQDDTVVVPLSMYKRRILNMPSKHVSVIIAAAQDAASVPLAQKQIKDLLRQRHRLPDDADDDFTIRTIQDLAQTAQETTRVLTLLLAGIAAVSLLVGGIGIMNIMLVSVTERTREIGIRMAVGARGRDILAQFLVESVVLSLVGGLGGIALGSAAARMMAKIGGWPTSLGPGLFLLAFGFAASVGVFFGFYPARRAAAQSPIEALRYE